MGEITDQLRQQLETGTEQLKHLRDELTTQLRRGEEGLVDVIGRLEPAIRDLEQHAGRASREAVDAVSEGVDQLKTMLHDLRSRLRRDGD
ncbi:MAG: hypothetical protein B7733_02205 [Myxococcales bacterium FL481]|nr:MAG: hypothetical protein B7733_02205 [Myxococcales bacterium FL481]